MKHQIVKFPLCTLNEQTVKIPEVGLFMCIQVIDKIPCLIYRVDINQPSKTHTFLTRTVGDLVDHNEYYVGSYQIFDAEYTFHIFERL